MAKEDFTKQINFSGRFASIDKRYANGNTPYASTDEVISILGSGILSAKYVGFPVLVKESGWTKAKEYWVQPKGTTPETYGLVEKGAGTTDYNNLENKPTIGDGTNTALPIVGNVKVSVSTASGETAGVTVTPGQNSGEIEMQFTLPKGDKGEDGADGADGAPGHNPCLGRFNVLPTLSPNPFADAREGDYIYFDTTDQQTSDPVTYIYYFDGTDWDTTGALVDVSNLSFSSGQDVVGVSIKDINGEDDPNAQGVLSAEAGKKLADEVFVDVETQISIQPVITSESAINYVGTIVSKTGTTWKVGKFEIPSGITKIYVTGHNHDTSSSSSDLPLMVELDNNEQVIAGCIHLETGDTLYENQEYTLNNDTKYVLVGRKGVDNPEVKYDVNEKKPSFYKKEDIGDIDTLNNDYDNIVDGINSLAESTAISETINDGEKIAQIGENKIKIPECVKKYQGVGYAGKVLQVGEDGKVTLGDGTGSPQDTAMCVSRKDSKIVHLGPDLLTGITGLGTGWTYSDGKYTHTSGNTEPLVFNVPTTNNTYYIVKIGKSGSLVEEGLMVSVGDGELCDCYDGTDNFTIGVKSEDGGYLKITPKTGVFSGSITLVELHQVVESGGTEETLTLYNVEASTMSQNMSGWYCIAIGGNDALASNINGSRNLAIGMHSLSSLKSGERNVGLGTFTMKNMVWGVRNIAIGADALMYVTQAEDNVAIGKGTFDNSSVAENYGDSPKRNVAIGSGAMQTNKENAADNVCIGYRAGRSANSKNVCIGSNAGYTATQQNVYIGYRAGFRSTGDNNVIIGANRNTSVDKNIGNCVFVGCLSAQQVLDASGISNSIAIGYNVKVEANNTCVIGNTDITTFKLGPYTLVFDSDSHTVKFTI